VENKDQVGRKKRKNTTRTKNLEKGPEPEKKKAVEFWP
jgi:hypothetical protein